MEGAAWRDDFGEEAPRAPFVPDRAEKWGVPASIILGYAWVMHGLSDGAAGKGWLVAFAAMLCLGVGLATRGERRSRECWVWLSCLWTCLLGGVFGKNRVWGEHVWLLIHAFGAYWMLARSGRLLEDGGSSIRLPADLIHGLAVVPFGNFLMRVRAIKAMAAEWKDGRRLNPLAALSAFVAAAVALALFYLAAAMLSDADPNFERLAGGLLEGLDRIGLMGVLPRLLLSLPVGAYLYALVFGLRRETMEKVAARRSALDAGIAAARRVPKAVWPALMGLFAAMYAAFFALQGSYLFDGLRGLLPEAFTASEYARRGFFELCGVMAVNFTLLGLSAATAEGGLRANPTARWLATILLVESALLAVTAGAKLWLYIDRFGFTPLRLQSAWLVAVLFMGCLAALRHLWTGRDTTLAWLLFSGVALAALCLV